MNFTAKAGSVVVTPRRMLSIVFPAEGQASTYVVSYVDRRALRHVASGVSVDLGKILLGLVLCLGGLGSIAANAPSGSSHAISFAGACATVVGALIIYLARSGALAMFDDSNTTVRIRLKRKEFTSAADFARSLGATLGR